MESTSVSVKPQRFAYAHSPAKLVMAESPSLWYIPRNISFCRSADNWFEVVVVVVVEILFRIADQTGRFAQYYDGDIIREVNSKEMKCLVHVVYHQ